MNQHPLITTNPTTPHQPPHRVRRHHTGPCCPGCHLTMPHVVGRCCCKSIRGGHSQDHTYTGP